MGVHNVVVQLGNDGMRVHDAVVNTRNESVGVHDTTMNLGDGYVCIYREFGLRIKSWQQLYRSNGTYVEDMKDPDEVHPPGGDRFLVVLCVEKSRECIPFTLLDDLFLDIRDSPGIRPEASSVRCSKCVLLV